MPNPSNIHVRNTRTVDTLSIAAWNICGIKEKVNDPDFLEQLLPHDVVILTETFAKNADLHIQGYKCINIFRNKKHKKAKRNSGGVSVLTKMNNQILSHPSKQLQNILFG